MAEWCDETVRIPEEVSMRGSASEANLCRTRMLESQGSLAEWTPLGRGGKHVPRVMPLLMSLDYQSGKVMAVGSRELHRAVLPKQAQRLVSALASRGGPQPHGP